MLSHRWCLGRRTKLTLRYRNTKVAQQRLTLPLVQHLRLSGWGMLHGRGKASLGFLIARSSATEYAGRRDRRTGFANALKWCHAAGDQRGLGGVVKIFWKARAHTGGNAGFLCCADKRPSISLIVVPVGADLERRVILHDKRSVIPGCQRRIKNLFQRFLLAPERRGVIERITYRGDFGKQLFEFAPRVC